MTPANGQREIALAALLTDGLFLDGDWVESKDQDPSGDVRLIQLADIGEGAFHNRSRRFLTRKRARELGCTFLEVGDILIARMPDPLGRACLFPGVGQPAVTAVDVCIVRPNPARASPQWLVKAINSPQFRESMQAHVRGTTRQRISRKNLGTLTLNVPSIKEQHAVAEWLDKFDEPRTSARDHLRLARATLDRFRQSVLAAACSGRLTADWRDTHPRTRTEIVVGSARSINEHAQFDVPDSWRVIAMGAVLSSIKYGTSRRTDYSKDGAPVLRIPNVSGGKLDLTDLKRAHLLPKEAQDLALLSGDLLMVRSNGSPTLLGVTVEVAENADGMAFAGYLIRLRVDQGRIDPGFLVVILASPPLRRQIEMPARSTSGVHNINTTEIARLGIPLPPIEEQHEIVSRVERLLAQGDAVEQRLGIVASYLERASRAALGAMLGTSTSGAAATAATGGFGGGPASEN